MTLALLSVIIGVTALLVALASTGRGPSGSGLYEPPEVESSPISLGHVLTLYATDGRVLAEIEYDDTSAWADQPEGK